MMMDALFTYILIGIAYRFISMAVSRDLCEDMEIFDMTTIPWPASDAVAILLWPLAVLVDLFCIIFYFIAWLMD